MEAKAIFWQALTPVHPGTGQDSSSVIDLPVAREAATKFPVIPASSIKGVLRDGRGLKKDEEYSEEELLVAQSARKTFGFAGKRKKANSDEQEDVSQAAELTLTDARILFLPVRSYAGTFALISCPLVLQRLRRDADALGIQTHLSEIRVPKPDQVCVIRDSEIVHDKNSTHKKVILEDIDLSATEEVDELAKALSKLVFGLEENYFLKRFALVSNDVFSYFCESGLEVIARVQLEPEQKTVKEGPWYEEAIPAEAIFSGFALSSTGDFSELNRPYIQIGGQASVGRGLLRQLGVSHG